jgi:hypothetical protein
MSSTLFNKICVKTIYYKFKIPKKKTIILLSYKIFSRVKKKIKKILIIKMITIEVIYDTGEKFKKVQQRIQFIFDVLVKSKQV